MRYSKDNFLCFEILVQKLKGAYLYKSSGI